MQIKQRASHHLCEPVKPDEFLSQHSVHGLLINHRVLVHHHLYVKRGRKLRQDVCGKFLYHLSWRLPTASCLTGQGQQDAVKQLKGLRKRQRDLCSGTQMVMSLQWNKLYAIQLLILRTSEVIQTVLLEDWTLQVGFIIHVRFETNIKDMTKKFRTWKKKHITKNDCRIP